MVLLLVILNLKGALKIKKTCCINSCNWGRGVLTVLWYAGRSSKQQRLLVLLFVILNLKEQSPRDQKARVVSTLAVGAEQF